MFIKIKNLTIHYKVLGEGPDLVLLPGWGCSGDVLAPLQQYLALGFKTYTFDLPGFGMSAKPAEIWGIAEYAALVGELIVNLSLKNPVIIGHSFGGKVACFAVAKSFVNVKKLVLIGTPAIRFPPALKTRCKIFAFKFIKAVLNLPLLRDFFAKRLAHWRNKFGSEDYRNAEGIMRQILVKTLNENLAEDLPKILVPTLLIWGDQDFAAELKIGEAMAKLISHAELKVINGSGHFPFIDNFARVKEILVDFFVTH